MPILQNQESLSHLIPQIRVKKMGLESAQSPPDCLDSLWRNRMPPPAAAVSDPDLMCEGARGLITKMIGSFREAGDSSTLRLYENRYDSLTTK